MTPARERAALLVELDRDIARGHAARCIQWSHDAVEEANELAEADHLRAAACWDVAAFWAAEAEAWRAVARAHGRRLETLRKGDEKVGASTPDPTGRAPSLLHYRPSSPDTCACGAEVFDVAHTTDPWEVSIADDPCPTCLPVACAALAETASPPDVYSAAKRTLTPVEAERGQAQADIIASLGSEP